MAKVFIGVDPHKLSATIEVVDDQETVLAAGRFGTDFGAGISCLTLARAPVIGACLAAPLPMVVALDLPGQAPTIVISALVIWAWAARTRSSPLDAPPSTVPTL